MPNSPRAGQPAQPEDLVDVDALLAAYHDRHPDPSIPAERVAFGTSGHRGSSLSTTFNDDHIAATSQAIVEYRTAQGTTGPLFIGRDTHALSEPAWVTACEVFLANDVDVLVDAADGYTPTPAVSTAIIGANRGRTDGLADGVVITPSHNPPRDGGFKYNPPHGGPADTDATSWIANRANELLAASLDGVQRRPLDRGALGRFDFLGEYVNDLPNVVDLDAIRSAGVRIGADPLGGASVAYWGAIAEVHKIDLTVVNPVVDPQFAFMTLDWDGKIRMDCSSPYAMASLVAGRDRYPISTGNDADSDRHGIVTSDAGLMNPNHFLAVAIGYLYANRPGWPGAAGVGKTAVSSSMIDRVAADLGRKLVETPVGFKWFVPGLIDGSLGFGGEESAGASFLRRDGVGVEHRQGRDHPGAAGVGDPGGDGAVALAALRGADRAVRRARLRADRRRHHAGGEGEAGQALGERRDGVRAGRRTDHRPAHRGARQRGAAGRAEGRDRGRLVRCAPVGHRGRLQGVRRELPRPRAPGAHPGGGARRRRVSSGGLMLVRGK